MDILYYLGHLFACQLAVVIAFLIRVILHLLVRLLIPSLFPPLFSVAGGSYQGPTISAANPNINQTVIGVYATKGAIVLRKSVIEPKHLLYLEIPRRMFDI